MGIEPRVSHFKSNIHFGHRHLIALGLSTLVPWKFRVPWYFVGLCAGNFPKEGGSRIWRALDAFICFFMCVQVLFLSLSSTVTTFLKF
jgi:hypothetical protein